MWIIDVYKYFWDQSHIFLFLVFLYLHDSECICILSKWSVFVLGVGTGQRGSIFDAKTVLIKIGCSTMTQGIEPC